MKEAQQDDRFKAQFDDADFAIDKNSEHYKAIKTTAPKQKVDSDNEDQPNLNQLFAGRNKTEQDEEADFATKMKNNKKGAEKKDKIISNYGTVNRTLPQVSQKSKDIKKFEKKMKKNDISEQSVRNKLKERRVVMPSIRRNNDGKSHRGGKKNFKK